MPVKSSFSKRANADIGAVQVRKQNVYRGGCAPPPKGTNGDINTLPRSVSTGTFWSFSTFTNLSVNFYTKTYYIWLWWKGQETFSFYPQCGGRREEGGNADFRETFFFIYELQAPSELRRGNIKCNSKQKFQ